MPQLISNIYELYNIIVSLVTKKGQNVYLYEFNKTLLGQNVYLYEFNKTLLAIFSPVLLLFLTVSSKHNIHSLLNQTMCLFVFKKIIKYDIFLRP